jgi:hypothetical protein
VRPRLHNGGGGGYHPSASAMIEVVPGAVPGILVSQRNKRAMWEDRFTLRPTRADREHVAIALAPELFAEILPYLPPEAIEAINARLAEVTDGKELMYNWPPGQFGGHVELPTVEGLVSVS